MQARWISQLIGKIAITPKGRILQFRGRSQTVFAIKGYAIDQVLYRTAKFCYTGILRKFQKSSQSNNQKLKSNGNDSSEKDPNNQIINQNSTEKLLQRKGNWRAPHILKALATLASTPVDFPPC